MISAPFNHLIAAQLAPILTKIFYGSLELREVPSCFKRSTIPKKAKITGLNDYKIINKYLQLAIMQ